jgi:hypothetical protein
MVLPEQKAGNCFAGARSGGISSRTALEAQAVELAGKQQNA